MTINDLQYLQEFYLLYMAHTMALLIAYGCCRFLKLIVCRLKDKFKERRIKNGC